MTKRVFRLNKRDLNKDERLSVSKYYRGLTAYSDTLTESIYDDNNRLVSETTYYIFKGSWTPYGACVKHDGRYVFARYSRYDSLSEDFTDFSIDCDEKGADSKIFETKHFNVNNMTVEY
jgi:hypothetical protein